MPRFSLERLTLQQWIWVTMVMTAIVLALSFISLSVLVIKVPYISHSPGNVYSTPSIIEVTAPELEVYEPDTDIGFVTVAVSERLSLWQFLFDSLDDRIDIYKVQTIHGDQTPDEIRVRNQNLMTAAQDNASWLALLFLGLVGELQLDATSATLACLTDSGDADGTIPYIGFLPGDVVKAAAIGATGELIPMAWTTDLYELLVGLTAGETVRLQIERTAIAADASADNAGAGDSGVDGTSAVSSEIFEIEVQAEAVPIAEDDTAVRREYGSFAMKTTFANPGIAAADEDIAYRCLEQTWSVYHTRSGLADSIALDSGTIGGPSAGLAFTLAAIDLLSEGNLIGDLKVAVTGSITNTARVGAIGGVAQKAVAVRHAGYDVFLVPKGSNYEEAVAEAGDDLLVIGVGTVGEAIAVLACLGGDPVQPGRNYHGPTGPTDLEALEALECVPGWTANIPSVAAGL